MERKMYSSWEDLTWNPNVTKLLREMVQKKDTFPHCIFYGVPGAGKRTCVSVLLHEWNAKKEEEWDVLEYKDQVILQTSFCIQLHPKAMDVEGIWDCICTSKPFTSSSSSSVRLIVMYEADLLSPMAQQRMFYFMDQHITNVRFLFVTNHITHLTKSLQSRCFLVRMPLPVEKRNRPGSAPSVLASWQQEVRRLICRFDNKWDFTTLLIFVPIGSLFHEICVALIPHVPNEEAKKEIYSWAANYEAKCHIRRTSESQYPKFHLDAFCARIQANYPMAIKALSTKE